MSVYDELVPGRVERAMQLTESLVESLGQQALALSIPDVRSNRISEQIWCVVGARESYLRAARHGTWQGFTCSLDREDLQSSERVLAALRATRSAWSAHLASSAPSPFALDVLEHETQHHGQLIRYVYANDLQFPDDFAQRYALSRH